MKGTIHVPNFSAAPQRAAPYRIPQRHGPDAHAGAPRQHPKSQIQALTKSFKVFGQVLLILIDAESRIISGHAQWEVATRLDMSEVMVIRIEYMSEPKIKALMIALNRLSDLSTWDDAALRTVLLDLHDLELDFDIEATGFNEIEIELRIENLEGDGAAVEDDIIVGSGPIVTQAGINSGRKVYH